MVKRISGIYKITSPSGRVYIGQSWHISKRFNEHRRCCKDSNRILSASIKKYGAAAHSFEVINELPFDITQDVLDVYENLYINQYKNCGVDVMNLKEGGCGGKMSDETRKKMSESGKKKVFTESHRKNMSLKLKGKASPMKGRKQSNEAKAKVSAFNKGKKRSKEELIKRVATRKALGIKPSSEHMEMMRQINIGRPLSQEHKLNISAAQKGKTHSEETKKKMSESAKLREQKKKEEQWQ